ncbi:hypothetical protein QR680_005173 [Steinernema hermaphroditum]|uniref:Uncharacterized protein n=1 Tax=Steinernema hermaphroditum TaxID=289476 RepID=A0AA39LUW0_9BILA|nr:hypothetical protein QR680_005173 [Steinernema hermaphroditum]
MGTFIVVLAEVFSGLNLVLVRRLAVMSQYPTSPPSLSTVLELEAVALWSLVLLVCCIEDSCYAWIV